MSKLNERQEKFARLVASGVPAMRAYAEAGYSAKTAEKNAARLKDNEGVKAFIAKLKKQTSKKFEATKDDLLNSLLETSQIYDGHERIAAIKQIAVMCGYNEPEKIEHSVSDETAQVLQLMREGRK